MSTGPVHGGRPGVRGAGFAHGRGRSDEKRAEIRQVSDVILAGLIKFDSPDKAVISRNGYQVIIRKNYRINGKKLETKNWVLTAYSKESSDTTQAPPGIN